MTWEIEYYEDEDGGFPVREFLDGLSARAAGKVYQVIQMLEEQGPTLAFPYSSQVEGRLRELRTQLGNMRYRLLYYGDRERRFVLLYGLRKRTEKLPEPDRTITLERMHRDIALKGARRRRS